jgi:hypothetical protein
MKKVKLPKMCRFDFFNYSNRVTIRTFNKDVYILRPGLVVQNVETSEYKRIEEIYYDIRTVRTIKGTIVAKRKNRECELYQQNKAS